MVIFLVKVLMIYRVHTDYLPLTLLGFTFPDILYSICTQTTQQEPGNPHKCWISELHFFIQTPDRQYGVLTHIDDFKGFLTS